MKVQCIENNTQFTNECRFTFGKIYEVTRVWSNDLLSVKNDKGETCYVQANHFEVFPEASVKLNNGKLADVAIEQKDDNQAIVWADLITKKDLETIDGITWAFQMGKSKFQILLDPRYDSIVIYNTIAKITAEKQGTFVQGYLKVEK